MKFFHYHGDIWNKGELKQRRQSSGIYMLWNKARNKAQRSRSTQEYCVPQYQYRRRTPLRSKCSLFGLLAVIFVFCILYIFSEPHRYLDRLRKGTNKLGSRLPLRNMTTPPWAISLIIFCLFLLVAMVVFGIGCFWYLRRRRQQLEQTRAPAYHQSHQYPNADPRLRHGRPPTVIIYDTDKMQAPPPNSAPRFYWREEPEEVTDDNKNDGSKGTQSSNEPVVEFPDDYETSGEPIVEFPDDDDDENDS